MKTIFKIALLLVISNGIVLADGFLDRGESVVRSSNTKYMTINQKGIKIVVSYPKRVYAGDYFIIKASMSNYTDYARMGGLTLSFPQMTSVAGETIYNSFDSIKGYAPYSRIYNKYLRKAKRSEYYMIEGWEKRWKEGVKRTMRLRIKAPYSISKFYVNVRGVLHLGSKYDRYEVTVPRNGYEDQQGYSVKTFSINIID